MKNIFFLLITFHLIILSFSKCKKGEEIIEISYENGSGLTDINGNYYPSIILGNGQEWTTTNLRTNTYSNGSNISNTISDASWSNNTDGAWCYYDNDPLNDDVYGKLYNWHAIVGDTIVIEKYKVESSNGDISYIYANNYTSMLGTIEDTIYIDSFECKICPDGWKIPYENDWINLINYLGYANVAGGKMKSEGFDHWLDPNLGATNESGFNGLPGGVRNKNGSFEYLGEIGRWWSFEHVYDDYAHSRPLFYDQETTLNHYVFPKEGGLSIRLIKN